MHIRPKAVFCVCLIFASIPPLSHDASAQAPQPPQSERQRVQAELVRIDNALVDLDAKEADLNKRRAFLRRLPTDKNAVIIKLRDPIGYVPIPASRVEDLVAAMAMGSLLNEKNTDDPDSLLERAREELLSLSEFVKALIQNDLKTTNDELDAFDRERARLIAERDRLRVALAQPIRPSAPPLPPPTPEIHDLWGTWKLEHGGPDVCVITGDRSAYAVTGTNGKFKNEGTIKGDGIKYEGDVSDQPGWCCGREGHVWLEVIDKNTYRARSIWWKTGQSSRERPEITNGWSTWKRQTK
jgi:hypothetical protein